MHITTTLTALLLAASSVAALPDYFGVAGRRAAPPSRGGFPWYGDNNNGHGSYYCGLTSANLKDIIDGYTYILVHPGGPDFNATANRLLTNDFSVYSDSINSLAGRALGGPSFQPGKQPFINSQYLTPPIPSLQTLDVFVGGEWNNTASGNGVWNGYAACSNLKLSWRWLASGIGSNQYPVKGIIDMDLAPGPAGGAPVGIKTVYSEFNTAAWLRNYGVQCVTPPRQ